MDLDSSISAYPSPTPTAIPSATSAPSVRVSSVIDLPTYYDGYNLVAVSSGGSYYTATQSGGQAIFYTAGSSTKIASTISSTWSDLCMSSDGSVQVLIGNSVVYYVANYAFSSPLNQATYTLAGQFSYTYCALNGNGNVLVTASSTSLALYSNPSGNNANFAPGLTPVTNLPSLSYDGSIVDVAVDATGQIIAFITVYGYLYLSNNQGASWQNPVIAGPSIGGLYVDDQLSSLAMSQNNYGQYMTSGIAYETGVYFSTNQGKYFNLTTQGNLGTFAWGGWYNLASSYSGQYVVGAMQQGIFLSKDYGQSWNSILPYYGYRAYSAIDPLGNIICTVNTGSSEIEIYNMPNVPTPSPTTFKPTVSSAPTLTHYPSYSPTAKPSSIPTPKPLTTGWVYDSYYGTTDCTGTAQLVEGYRLGVCFVGNSGAGYKYTCNSGKSYVT